MKPTPHGECLASTFDTMIGGGIGTRNSITARRASSSLSSLPKSEGSRPTKTGRKASTPRHENNPPLHLCRRVSCLKKELIDPEERNAPTAPKWNLQSGLDNEGWLRSVHI